MGPVFVVMGHEHLEHTLKVFLVQNEQPVETFRADGAHEPFGHPIGLWGAERRANDFDPVTPEHVIKLVGELLVPITNQEANGFRAARQRPGQLASALDDPRRAGMRCASGQMHTTAAQLDETANRLCRCVRTNSRQVIPRRVPDGPRPAALSQGRTVVAETGMPRPFNLPTIR
jgi:hypothetical protein